MKKIYALLKCAQDNQFRNTELAITHIVIQRTFCKIYSFNTVLYIGKPQVERNSIDDKIYSAISTLLQIKTVPHLSEWAYDRKDPITQHANITFFFL